MKIITLFLLFMLLAGLPRTAISQQQPLVGDELVVGYYGRPEVASLGILGEYSIEDLTPLIQAKADEYKQISGDKNVIPAYHLIYGLAAADPGPKKQFLLPLSSEKMMAYINAAQSNGFLVIIDTQLGALTPVEAIKPVLKYLNYENVHLAIDPEFEVNDLDVPPGKLIGHVTGEQINQAQAAMSDYMKENHIEHKKILIVHMFTANMVKEKEAVKPFENIKLIMNLDGHGSAELKIKIYNGLYTSGVASKIPGGFKLFFKEDKPFMMTPAQVLGQESIGGKLIAETPHYINYQ